MKVTREQYIAVRFVRMVAASTEPVTIEAAAERLGASVSFLNLIAAKLREAGYVVGKRGNSGGYRFAREHAYDYEVADCVSKNVHTIEDGTILPGEVA